MTGPERWRLPIDVLVGGGQHGRPKLDQLEGGPEDFALARSRALQTGDHNGRALACWGLVACGEASLAWCRQRLSSGDAEDVEDAAGIVAFIGVPADWLPWLEALAAAADEEIADAVVLLLPPEAAARVAGDASDEQAPAELAGVPLGGRYDPFTQVIYFVEAEFDRVEAARLEWIELQGWHHLQRTHIDGSLETVLQQLEPWAEPSWKVITIETDSGWTAIFSQGSDLSWARHYARVLDCYVARTSYAPHVVRGGRVIRYGGTALWLVHGDKRRNRTIQASRQSSKWDWDLSGTPLAFETPERYQARRVRDRFDQELLNTYCRRLGIRRDDPAFYGPRAVLEVRPSVRKGRILPSAQWRREHS